ncbi:MAG: hypothetical protein FJZ43_02855, partial [Candidatus Staskawiczbacteria bacterium]|nr:hypothetical protein [Candidatus Staskawiczbacteria bacterium]
MNFINKLKIKGKNLPLILIAFCVFGFIPKFSYAIGVTDIALTFAIVAFPFAIEWLFWILADKVAAPILNLVVTHLINGTSFTVTRDLIVLNLWSVARDWANLLIVVGLIGVAIATILNLEKYKAQKLLAPLLIVALLVNFSVLFVGLIIDSSNIIMNNFFGNSAGGAREIVSSVVRVERIYVSSFYAEFIDTPLTTNSYTHLFLAHLGVGILGLVARIIEMAAIYFLLAVSFIYLAIVLVARYAMLVFLFIISPIAFVFMVFPIEVCQKVWKSWWEHFIRWCFIGVGLGFSLRLSVDMFNALSRFRISQTTIGEMELRIFVVTMILAVGVYTTLKSAPAVAKAAMGIVKTAGLAIATGGTALAGKVGLGAGKMVGYGTGLDRATDNLKRGFYNAKDYANRGLENIGLARRGTMAANRKARETKSIEGDVKLMQNLS